MNDLPSGSAGVPRAFRLALAAVVLVGCGYRFAASGGTLPEGVRALYVPLFANSTPEPGTEAYFTEALRAELARAGQEGGAAADAAVRGELVELFTGPAIVAPAGRVSYRLRATVRLHVVREGKTIKELKLVGSEDYLSSSASDTTAQAMAILEMEANRRLALRRLAQTLMRQAYEGLTANWYKE